MPNFKSATVVRKEQASDRAWSFHLKLDPEHFEAAEPGAHVDVEIVPGVIRQYSLVSEPVDGIYEIAVLNETDGRGGSRTLCSVVKEGDRLGISSPRNHFALETGAAHYVLIAGGIGITPLLYMADALSRSGASFEFHISAQTPESVPLRKRIEASPWAGYVNYYYSKTAPQSLLDLSALLGKIEPHAQVYACGPTRMLDAIAQLSQGWDPHRVRTERFVAVNLDTDPSLMGDFTVETARTGKRFAVDADTSLLDALASQDLFVDSSCREGVCATCVTRVLSGDLIHRDSCLYDDERAAGNVMAVCVSRAKPGSTLVLDL